MSRRFPHAPDLANAAVPVEQDGSAPPVEWEGSTTVYGWAQQPGFGPYLRRLRKGTGLSLRAAGEGAGISYAYLARLETEVRKSPPGVDLLLALAHLYGANPRDLCVEAGFQFQKPAAPEPAIDDPVLTAFTRLMLHPDYRPARMNEREIEMISPLLQRQLLEFAHKLAPERVMAAIGSTGTEQFPVGPKSKALPTHRALPDDDDEERRETNRWFDRGQ